MQDIFNTADPLPPDQLVQLYYNYLEEIEEENHKRKLEDEEYEKKKQKLVRIKDIWERVQSWIKNCILFVLPLSPYSMLIKVYKPTKVHV